MVLRVRVRVRVRTHANNGNWGGNGANAGLAPTNRLAGGVISGYARPLPILKTTCGVVACGLRRGPHMVGG
jgi:hypothetical protein